MSNIGLTGKMKYNPAVPPTEAIHGTVQKVIQEGNKKTYVIIIKPNKDSLIPQKKPTARSKLTKKTAATSDIVKQNLSNITDEDYDSKKSAADLFLNADEDVTSWPDDGESAGLYLKNNTKDKNNLHKDKPVGNADLSHDSIFNATPTNLQFLPKHSAVRQIMMSSPDFQTTPEQQRISSVIRKLDDGTKLSPLASSTPVGSAPQIGQFDSPDSGIYSGSSSMLSPNMVSPDQKRPTELLITRLIEKPALNNQFTGASTDNFTSSQEGSDDKLNTSLANIQWLGGFVLEKEEKEKETKHHVVNRMSVEDKCRRKPFELEEIDRLIRDCGELLRPPYSYMVLIQLALSSAPNHKMTLREICKWIEDKFPYFKSVAKPGWKNSIRHNLSFYHCFARDLSNKKKHGSKWMLQFDPMDSFKDPSQERIMTTQVTTAIPNAQTQTVYPLLPMFSTLPNSNIVFPSLHQYPVQQQQQAISHLPNTCNYAVKNMGSGGLQNKKRKTSGPLPILPRPVSLQTYALVPLQSVQQQSGNTLPTIPNPNRPIIVSVPKNTFAQNIPLQQTHQGQQSLPSLSCHTTQIRQKPIAASEPVSLVRQAWIDAQCSGSEEEKRELRGPLPFTEHDPNKIKLEPEVIVQQAKKQKVKAGLPVPTIYNHNASRKPKRTKSRLKSSTTTNHLIGERNLLDSSDSECEEDMIKNSDLPTPIRQLFNDTTSENSISTSTPVRHSLISQEHLPSPIRGLTPVRCGNVFDGSFLDMIQEEVFASLGCSPHIGANISVNQEGSPNVSLSDFGIFRTPPDNKSGHGPRSSNNTSHGQSLCRFLADFPIDPTIIADVEGLPADLSLNLNWSSNQSVTEEHK